MTELPEADQADQPTALFLYMSRIIKVRLPDYEVSFHEMQLGSELIRGTGWRMAQLDSSTLFVVGGDSNPHSLLRLTEVNGAFRVTRLRETLHPRSDHSMCLSQSGDHLYVTGSSVKQHIRSASTCERYSVLTNKWESLPRLN